MVRLEDALEFELVLFGMRIPLGGGKSMVESICPALVMIRICVSLSADCIVLLLLLMLLLLMVLTGVDRERGTVMVAMGPPLGQDAMRV